MEQNGFPVTAKDFESREAEQVVSQVPASLQSCHTAIVDGYIIEGHVPVQEINRLLAERPDIAGLAVPGMPIGSPGMETPGQPAQPYNVIAFDQAGNTEVFASYGQ
ncbi:MAG TPA: DUF411 domain-containing protein [Anaerolineae bacterium]|nr:DUF411 domain-containing protein [Anaerolineae bacterium]